MTKKIKAADFKAELRALDVSRKEVRAGQASETANRASNSELRAPSRVANTRVDLTAQNVRLVDENSAFFGLFKPDDYSAFVEFDICHSLPVVAGPAYGTGNYTCWHPAALSKSHRGLLYKQTNLHHFIKSYDENEISQDRIIGCVLMTQYPTEPEGGWQIPDSDDAAIPIHACGTIFKQAEGAMEMLREHKSGSQKWSVSIEMCGRTFAEMGIYFPKQKKLVSFLDTPDEILEEAVSKNESGSICLGKFQGEQLALCYGGLDGEVIFRGVGFTPTPAEKTAKITGINLSGRGVGGADLSTPLYSARDDRLVSSHYEIEERPGGVMAMCASSAHTAVATAAVQRRYVGAELMKLWTEGRARLKDQGWFLEATAEKPVLEIRLSDGKRILKYLGELAG